MTDDLTLNMNAYLPLRDVVFNTLREAILKGDLKPGERLMELQLASKLGVSRTPIREAIRMLEQEGLAVTTPRKGAEVAKMTLKDMEDVLEIREALEESGLPAECMGVELTESGYLDPGGHFRKVWQGLKALGVKVLLDDFGTRYSNFHCLGDLTPNGLKIDRSFTRQASYEFNLLAQMIQMSKRLGIYVCIEGIETQEELERILMLEPDRIQGYYFSRPLPEELFRKKFIRQKEMSGNA